MTPCSQEHAFFRCLSASPKLTNKQTHKYAEDVSKHLLFAGAGDIRRGGSTGGGWVEQEGGQQEGEAGGGQ